MTIEEEERSQGEGSQSDPPLWGQSPLPWVAKRLFLRGLEASPILGREATFTVGRATPESLKGFQAMYGVFS